MGQPSIKEIEEQLASWDFLQQLPKQVGEFTFRPGTGINGQILNIASYVSEETHRRLDLTYTSETFDYVPVKTVGLHVFRDERFFYREKEEFAEQILKGLPRILSDISAGTQHQFPSDADSIGFDKWDFWRSLPKKIGNFEQFINPDNPLCYINGSYIILDYSDFSNGNQVFFLYNTFRNELFAEKKKGHMPYTTDAFDVLGRFTPDEKMLDKFSKLIEEKLEATLAELEK